MWIVFKTIYEPSLKNYLISDHVTKESAKSYAEKYAKEFMVQEEGIKRSVILDKDSNLDPSREGYFIKYSKTNENRIEIWKKDWIFTQSMMTSNRKEVLKNIGFYSYEKILENDPQIIQEREQKDFELIDKTNKNKKND